MKTPRLFRHSCKYNVCKISSKKPLNQEQMIDFMFKTNRSFFSYFDYKYHCGRKSGIYNDFFNSTSKKLKELFQQLDNFKDKDYLKVMVGHQLTKLFKFDLNEYNPFHYGEINNNSYIYHDFFSSPIYPLNDKGIILFSGSGGRYVTIEQSFKFFKKLAKKCPYLKLDVSFGTYLDYNNSETYTNVCNFKIYNGKCKITKYNDNHYYKVWNKHIDKFKEIYPEFFEIKSLLNKQYNNDEVPKEDIEYYRELNKRLYDKINNQMQPILNGIAKKIDMGLETSNIDLESIHQEYYN